MTENMNRIEMLQSIERLHRTNVLSFLLLHLQSFGFWPRSAEEEIIKATILRIYSVALF